VRGVAPAVAVAVAVAGCGHLPPPVVSGPEVEMSLDEGRAVERPLTPDKTFEMLVRIDPKLPGFQPERMRFLLAQPGHIVFTVYAVDGNGHVGKELKVIDRVYGPELASTAGDGKWITESLADVPVQRAPIFVGLYSPEKHGDPRLWASANDSGEVFQRELDAANAAAATRIPRTPKLRVVVEPRP
jgi:hypothetical protein